MYYYGEIIDSKTGNIILITPTFFDEESARDLIKETWLYLLNEEDREKTEWKVGEINFHPDEMILQSEVFNNARIDLAIKRIKELEEDVKYYRHRAEDKYV